MCCVFVYRCGAVFSVGLQQDPVDRRHGRLPTQRHQICAHIPRREARQLTVVEVLRERDFTTERLQDPGIRHSEGKLCSLFNMTSFIQLLAVVLALSVLCGVVSVRVTYFSRAASSGIPRQISRSNLPARRRAGSSESGRLVAPITNT